MKIAIFFIFFDFSLGGVQRKLTDLLNELGKYKMYEIYVPHIIIKYSKKFSFREKVTNNMAVFHEPPLGCIRQSGVLFSIYILFLTLKYRPYSIMLFQHQNIRYILLSKFFSICFPRKFILSQDTIPSLENNYDQEKYSTKLLSFFYQIPHIIITQTEYVKQDLVNHYNVKPEKITVIPNWVIDSPPPLKKSLDCIYCGRFTKIKQIDKMIHILSLIKIKNAFITLMLIGEGDEQKHIRQLISKEHLDSNITILPAMHTVRTYMARSKLFLLTSAFESYPMALLEAMATETVPVILEYPGVHEYIHHGYTGFIEKDMQSMVHRICWLLSHEKEREAIGKQARAYVLQHNGRNLIKRVISCITNRIQMPI